MDKANSTLYIVDDDPTFRINLKRLLRASGFRTMTFGSAEAFLAQSDIARPACLLLEVDLPDLVGISLQEKLVAQGTRLPIIFITGRGTISMAVKAMKAGAVDFITKPVARDILFSAIEAALEKDIQEIELNATTKEIQSLVNSLTCREKEIMRWVISGKLNKEIAYALGIAEKTVKIHRGNVMTKLKISNVAELVRFTERAHIVPID